MSQVAVTVAGTIPPVTDANVNAGPRPSARDSRQAGQVQPAERPAEDAPLARPGPDDPRQAVADPDRRPAREDPKPVRSRPKGKKAQATEGRTEQSQSAEHTDQPARTSFLSVLVKQIAAKAEGTTQTGASEAQTGASEAKTGASEAKAGASEAQTGASEAKASPHTKPAEGEADIILPLSPTANTGAALALASVSQAVIPGAAAKQIAQRPGSAQPSGAQTNAEGTAAVTAPTPGAKGAEAAGQSGTTSVLAELAARTPSDAAASPNARGDQPASTTAAEAAANATEDRRANLGPATQPPAGDGASSGSATPAALASTPGRGDRVEAIEQVFADSGIEGANDLAGGKSAAGQGGVVSAQPIGDGGVVASGGIEIIQQSSGGVGPGAAGETAPSGPAAQAEDTSVAGQLTQTLRTRGGEVGQEIILRLHPPELGQVRMTLQAEGDHVRGVLVVENPRTYGQLHQEMPALVQRLADSGVDLRRLEIVLDERPDASTSDGSSSMPRDEGGGQGPGADEGRSGSGSQADAPEEPPAEAEPDRPPPGPGGPAGQVGDESINVWI